MNIAEMVTVMRRLYEYRPVRCFSDAAPCTGRPAVGYLRHPPDRSAPVSGRSDPGRGTPWSRRHHAHAGRNDLEVAVVTGAVVRRRFADDLGEAGAERTERRTADADAGIGDRHPLAQKCFRSLDASCHEV